MILIIGAGLSGLLTAYRLKKASIPFKVLEARSRIGGRIHTVIGSQETSTEMGATWFYSQHCNLIGLLQELKIGHFEQYMDNPVFFQATPNSAIQDYAFPEQDPSYRISGGTSAIINALISAIDVEDVLFNQTVTRINFNENSLNVYAKDNFECSKVILALPPKLWANKIVFEPALPQELKQIAQQTHTWMEDSIKVSVSYQKPFWKTKNSCRTLFSNSGPMTELYEQCNHVNTKFALCGFMNPAYKQVSSAERKAHVLQQLKQVFGSAASDILDYEECIWSEEEHTFYPSENTLAPHQNNGNPIFRESYFNNRLLISSSESAAQFPGYMDGAVYAGNLAAKKIIGND